MFYASKTLEVNVSKKCSLIPSSSQTPAMQPFIISVKEKKEINRDSSCVILSKISTLSASAIISWKAKRRRVRGRRKKGKKVTGQPGTGGLLGVFTGLLKKNISKCFFEIFPRIFPILPFQKIFQNIFEIFQMFQNISKRVFLSKIIFQRWLWPWCPEVLEMPHSAAGIFRL